MSRPEKCLQQSSLAGRQLLAGLALAVLLPSVADAAFARRKVLTIDRNQVPGGVSLIDFPVLVSITVDGNLSTTANGGFVTSAAGHDILFRAEDAATCAPAAAPCLLDHEIEQYDGVAGTLVAWVRVPTLRSLTADTVIYLYYGDPVVTCSQENPSGVWNPGYREVFHLDESGDHDDSTANAFRAVRRGATTSGAAGRVGGAIGLQATASGAVEAEAIASDGSLAAGSNLTFEAWVNFNSYTAGNYMGIVTKGRECLYFDGSPDTSTGCPANPCGDWVGLYNRPAGGVNRFALEFAYGGGCKAGGLPDARAAVVAQIAAGTWYHVAGTLAGGTRRLFVNGQQVATDSVGACIVNAIPQYTRLGTDSNGTYSDARIDEVRVSTVARSADWLRTGYNNQSAPGTFYVSIADDPAPPPVTGTCNVPVNPCAGGPGSCNLRSIGNTAPYTTGTVTATNGSDTVYGAGTGWQSANRGRGDRVLIQGTNYMVRSVDGENVLRLTTPFAGPGGSGLAYTMSRQHATLASWESCISGGGACPYFTVPNGNLVAGNRSEVGIVYADQTYVNPNLTFSGSTTDAAHTITLTADGPNRHYGISGGGVVIDNTANFTSPIWSYDRYVTVEWMEIRDAGAAGSPCIVFEPPAGSNHQLVVRNNLIRTCSGEGILLRGPSNAYRADLTNNIIYRGALEAIRLDSPLGTGTGSRVRILSNTIFRNNGGAGSEITTAETPNPYVTLRNNVFIDGTGTPNVQWNGGASPCTYGYDCPWWNAASGPNISADPAPPTGPWKPALGHSPRGGGIFGTTEASLVFTSTTAGSEDFHLKTGSVARNAGSDLPSLVSGDIDGMGRATPWDIGADELTALAAPPLIVYSDTSPPEPALRPLRFTTLQAAAWTAPGTVAVPGPFPTGSDWPLWNKVARTSRDGLQRGAVFAEADGGNRNPLHATFWDGSAWTDGAGTPGSHYFGVSGDTTNIRTRHFDAAFEQLSGDFLVVAGINTDESVDMYLHGGSTWSGNLRNSPVGNGTMLNQIEIPAALFRWVRLAPRPGTNQIAFIGLAHDPGQTQGVVHAAIWNGDTETFGSKTILSRPVTHGQNANPGEGVDIDYVLGGVNAGEAVAVWGNGTTLRRSIYSTGGTWGSTAIVQDLGVFNTVRFIRQKAASLGDDMILAIEDVNEQIFTIRYDGDTRTFSSFTATPLTSSAYGSADSANRPFDVAWDPGAGPGHVLLVYSDTTGIRYRTSADGGATWSGELTLTASFQAHWIQAERDPSNVVHVVVKDQNDDLRAWTWSAGTWTLTTTPTLPSTSIEHNGASQNVESFALATWPPSGTFTTAVELMAFKATPGDTTVDVQWQTGSELDNLGFHLYRSPSAEGPWTRLTASLIPGLGSSPVGASYSWRDTGLQNGTPYFYRLEDVDTASVSTFHGPVSATPAPGTPIPGGEVGGSSGGEGGSPGPGGDTEPEGSIDTGPLPACSEATAVFPCAETYGDPQDVSVRVVSRQARRAVVELVTGGFVAVREASGRVRVQVPGFEEPDDPHAPALPRRRVVLPAPVGLRSRVADVVAEDVVSYPGLRPDAVGFREMDVRDDGTVRAVRRPAALVDLGGAIVPAREARLSGTGFLGEDKRLALEMMPVRYDAARGAIVLARRLLVTVRFTGRDAGESGAGSRGRRRPRPAPGAGETLAHLYTTARGLHAVPFETVFPGRGRALSLDVLRLQQGDRVVPVHVEPDTGAFGPRSVLYFYADREAASTDFSGEVAFELVRAGGGARMPRAPADPVDEPLDMPSLGPAAFEVNRIYQSGLLDADDRWLWENLIGGSSPKTLGFELAGVDTASSRPGRLTVLLQGGSDAEGVVDHHVRISVNGVFVGETVFDAKLPHRFGVSVPATVLREGANDLTVENVGDTGVHSLVFLDRFTFDYPQLPALRGGRLEGVWDGSGVVEIGGVPSAPTLARPDPTAATTRGGGPRTVRALGTLSTLVALDVTDGARPRWLVGLEPGSSSVRLRAEAGQRYVLVATGAAQAPRVAAPVRSSLRSTANRADYILIAPSAFLEAAQPLLQRRDAQGLRTRAVTLEEIASTFGGGSPSAEAIRTFLAHAYHSWRKPSPRYVLLLGDASQDPRNFTGASAPAPLPGLFLQTSYLWTVSDPALAAVNGDDLLPDLAIGRLPAQTAAEASALVAKVLAWEDSGQGLSDEPVVVADNKDAAGDFEADAQELASGPLAGRSPRLIFLSQLGGGTRGAILGAFDDGASTISYIGHGGAAVWASENVLNSWDTSLLQAQSRQPLMLTLNCLNGYFVAPTFDSLSEAFLKAEGRGTIAAFSPSGLSVDEPAHALHAELLSQIASGPRRLGDAILAAQRAYAEGGHMPELLLVYQLLGDPAMEVR